MPEPMLVEVLNLKKYYPVRRFAVRKKVIRAVDGVSFSIPKGHTLGLVGESGSGKSTTGRMVARLLPSTEGEILFKGERIAANEARSAKELSKRIQYVFQDPYTSLNPKHKIGTLLEEPLAIHRLGTRKERRQMVLEMLGQIGLDPSFAGKFIRQLSGGQRQRVVIARALMLRPELLVLDEPVSALDVSVQAQILNLLKDLQQRFSLTYLFISHDLNVVHYMSDQVAVMYLGKIVELADVERIYKEPLHPYTQTLVAAIPSVWKEEGRKRILLQGEMPDPASSMQGCSFHSRCPYAFARCRIEEPQPLQLDQERMVRCHLYSQKRVEFHETGGSRNPKGIAEDRETGRSGAFRRKQPPARAEGMVPAGTGEFPAVFRTGRRRSGNGNPCFSVCENVEPCLSVCV